MGDHLSGSWTKLDRAREHVDALEEAIVSRTTSRENIIGVRPYADSDGPGFHLVVELAPDYPLITWGVMVGDVLHNLRSALDHLAFQLVLTGTTPDLPTSQLSNVYFPICDRREDFRGTYGTKLPGLRLREVARIEREQPYKQYRNISLCPLRRLRMMSNADKHRVVTPLLFVTQALGGAVAAPLGAAGVGRIAWHAEVPYEVGSVIGYAIPESGADLEVDSLGQVSSYVAFEDGAHASVYFGAMLGRVEHILETFQPFFDALP